MFAVDQDRVSKSIKDLAGAFLGRLVHVGSRLGFFKVVRWLQDEWRRGVAIRELNRLNDHYLDDIGIDRSDIDSFVDTMVKRLRESRNGA